MCPPAGFTVGYAINPWMDPAASVDSDVAMSQWLEVVATMRAAGATVETIEPLRDAPDMVYAMNYGFVDGNRVALTSFRYAERRLEAAAAARWFAARGYDVVRLDVDGDVAFEAGDAFLYGGALLVAAGPRTDLAAHARLADALDVRVATVGIVHPALYHLDLSFCPLDERRAIVAPDAWDAAGRRTVRDLVAEPLVLTEEEAFTFCANSVVVGSTVVMPLGVPLRVARRLEAWGFDVAEVDVSELHKGGGSIRCMTLPLDTVLDSARRAAGARFVESELAVA
jgi:N-dimethylarginine dimethylaminohydrolase